MHLALVNSSATETYEVSKKHGNDTSASPLLEMLTRQHNQDFVESSSECWCQSLLDHCIWSPGKSPAQLTQSPSIRLCIPPYTTILHIHLLSLLLMSYVCIQSLSHRRINCKSITLHFPSANFMSMFRRAIVLLVASNTPTCI
jgi:hypothetical protein